MLDVFELEEKLEFTSYLTLVLVPHWIGDGRLGSIYTNSSHAYCYECWALATSPHAHTRAEPTRAGCGWRAPTTCGYECSSIQGLVGPATFCWFFYFLFLFKKFCWEFSGRVGPVQENRICTLQALAHDHIFSQVVTNEKMQRVINTLSLHVSFTRNRNRSTLFLPQISYKYSAKK